MVLLFPVSMHASVHSQEYSQVPDSLFKGSHAIVLQDDTRVELLKDNFFKAHFKKKVLLLSKKAKAHQSVKIHFKEGSEKIKDVKISIYDRDEKLLKAIKSKDLKDYASGDGYSIITDNKLKYWEYQSNVFPVIIEYEYTKESKNTLSIPSWFPLSEYNTAVLSSNYSIKTDLGIRKEVFNNDQFGSVQIEDFNFSMSNQKPIKKKKYSPHILEIIPFVLMESNSFFYENRKGQFDTWQGYGQWIYDSYLTNKSVPSEALIKKDLSGIISGEENDLEIAKKIYDYVQENTRYVSVALDEGGLNPMEPSKVHEVKYGDCKALSYYMKTLLDAYDIPSNYVEVCADADYKRNLFENYPSGYPGNHIILNIPMEGDTVWVDCTSDDSPFNFLGSFTDDRLALSINENGGQLVRTPAYGMDMNSLVDTINLLIENDNQSILEVHHKRRGIQMKKDMYYLNKSQSELEKVLVKKELKNLPTQKISEIQISLDEKELSTHLEYKTTLSHYTESLGDYILVPHNPMKMNIPSLPKDSKRNCDVFFSRDYKYVQLYTIDLPHKVKLIENEDVNRSSSFADYSLVYETVDENTVMLKKEFVLKQGSYPPSIYKKMKKFFDLCKKNEITPVKFKINE